MNANRLVVRKDGSMLRVPRDPFADFRKDFAGSKLERNLRAASPFAREDALSGIALARELEALSMVVSQTIYADLTSTEAFPMAPDNPAPGSTSYRWTEVDWTKGRVSSEYSDIGETVNLSRASTAQNIRPYITHAGYDLGDLQSAALAGIPLPAWKLDGARRAIEETMNADTWFGDTALGIEGLASNADIVASTTVVPNGAAGSPLWINKTPDEIEADVINLLRALVTIIKDAGKLMPNRLAMSVQSYSILATTARSQLSSVTILEFLKSALKAYSADFTITSHPELASGAPGDAAAAWMVAYRKDPMVAGRLVPQPIAFLAPQLEAFSTLIPCHAQAGGLSIRKPVAFLASRGM